MAEEKFIHSEYSFKSCSWPDLKCLQLVYLTDPQGTTETFFQIIKLSNILQNDYRTATSVLYFHTALLNTFYVTNMRLIAQMYISCILTFHFQFVAFIVNFKNFCENDQLPNILREVTIWNHQQNRVKIRLFRNFVCIFDESHQNFITHSQLYAEAMIVVVCILYPLLMLRLHIK